MSLAGQRACAGNIASLVLLPSVTLAMMVATASRSRATRPTPALLLDHIPQGRQHLRHMLLLGALYAAGFLGIMAISALVDGGRFAQVYMDGTPVTAQWRPTPASRKPCGRPPCCRCRCRCCSGMRRAWCTGTACRQ